MAISGETAVDAEKLKVVEAAAAGRSKKRSTKSTKTSPKAAWGKLISQCSQVDFIEYSHALHLAGSHLVLVVCLLG